MDSISYRKWDIWMNIALLQQKKEYSGYFECVITPTLMAQQTVEFLEENYNLKNGEIHEKINSFTDYSPQFLYNERGELCIKLYNSLNPNEIGEFLIKKVLKQLNAISLCMDFTLNCNRISFKSLNHTTIFYAMRKPLGRGMSFEVEERIAAKEKMKIDYSILLNTRNERILLVAKHYLTGINLMGLEDQFPGLIEAAFMQFYLGCECACKTHKIEAAKKEISNMFIKNSRDLQIIAHQVWSVRNNYFGHSTKIDQNASIDFEQAVSISKQVLVARYLCRCLLDALLQSTTKLIREIGFYSKGYSENFNGDVNELSNRFYVQFNNRKVKLYEKGIYKESIDI